MAGGWGAPDGSLPEYPILLPLRDEQQQIVSDDPVWNSVRRGFHGICHDVCRTCKVWNEYRMVLQIRISRIPPAYGNFTDHNCLPAELCGDCVPVSDIGIRSACNQYLCGEYAAVSGAEEV